MTSFNVEQVRADFPILSRKIGKRDLVYLDNAASAQKPNQVIDGMADMMRTSYANVHRGLHTLSSEATDAFEKARTTIATAIGAPNENEVIFTRGATEAINLVAHSWAAPRLKAGDEILITQLEHHSNIVPWHFLRERQGVTLKFCPVEADGSINLETFKSLITDKTKLVAFPHVSNALGVINPVKEMAAAAKAAGAIVLVDGCQAVPHMKVDVAALGADFYAFSGHKVYGPTGIGALWGRMELLEEMRPYQGGGEMIKDVFEDTVTYGGVPHKFEAGTPAIVEAVGLGLAFEYLNQFNFADLQAHEDTLLKRAMEQINGFNWLKVHGDTANKLAIISFTMEGAHPQDIATLLDNQGIAVRAGHHCAQPLMKAMGVSATCRASFAFYNTEAEVDAFVAGLQKTREMLA